MLSMRRQVHINLWISTAALVFAGYMALGSVALYGTAPLFVPLILLPLAPLGALIDRHFPLWRLLSGSIVIAYLLFLPLSLLWFGLMDAVILLIVFIQAHLIMNKKSVRAYYELFLMTFFLLLAAVVQDPESMVAIALLLYVISAVWSFISLQIYAELAGKEKLTVPEMQSLDKDAAPVKPGNVFDFGLYLSIMILSVLAVFLTVAIFLFTPRVEAGWLGGRGATQALTGLSDRMQLSGSTTISENPSVVMFVQFPDEPHGVLTPESLLYWRVTTMPRFTKDEWFRRGLRNHYEPAVNLALGQSGRGWGASYQETKRPQRPHSRSIRQTIYMDNVPTQGIPCLELPYGIRLLGESPYTRVLWDIGEDFTLTLETRGSRSIQYEVVSDVVSPTREELLATPHDYGFMVREEYDLLTHQELLPETRALAESLTEEAALPYAKVKLLEEWLSSPAFVYSLSVPPIPEEHGIDAFINTIRTGHCEFYASALALMARSLGIPTRVVSGFRGGEYSSGDEAYLIRASMAHLWMEALFKDIGWVRFDPSPRSDVVPSGLEMVRMAWSSYVLRGKMFWFQQVIGFRGGLRLDQLLKFRPWQWWARSAQPVSHDEKAVEEVVLNESVPYWELIYHPAVQALLFLLIFSNGLWLGNRYWKRQRSTFRLSRDQRRIRKSYLLFLKQAAALGVACDNKSAAEVWAQLKEMPLSDAAGVQAFLDAYYQVRFGGRPLDLDRQKRCSRLMKDLRLKPKREG